MAVFHVPQEKAILTVYKQVFSDIFLRTTEQKNLCYYSQ